MIRRIALLMDTTDKKLFDQIKNNSEKAFHKVFSNYSERFFAFVKTLTGNSDAAKDIVQEFFIKYWEKRHSLTFDVNSFRSYAYRSLFNASLNYLRDSKKIAGEYEINVDMADVDSADAETLDELTANLTRAIEQLPQRCKDIFVAAKIQKKTYTEIATQFGISENTVKVQVSKAYKMLRNKVSS